MATSSLFTEFRITDPETAEKFVNILDRTAELPWDPSPECKIINADEQMVKKFFEKRRQHQCQKS